MANLKSEQLRSDLSLEIDLDQALTPKQMQNKLIEILGKENCEIEKLILNDNKTKNVLVYHNKCKKEYLLLSAITYLGGNGQHPIYKKRVQLKNWYKDIISLLDSKNDDNINVRFIGVYHYENNIIFCDFIKNSYLSKKMNNSAAHVYTNDLFQAMKEGVFRKIDKNKNIIISVKYIKFKDYLDGNIGMENELFTFFKIFNNDFDFGYWLNASKAIKEMYEANWSKWKETEWAGWYLEYKFDKFIKDYAIENKIKYLGSCKSHFEYDFDLWFDEEKFYGDLKASTTTTKHSPGNDQETFMECINKYDKFWYVLYEHETLKDIDNNKKLNSDVFEATKFRTHFIKAADEWDKNKEFDELSYHKRMKHSVKFIRMSIIELNRINYREALNEFNQGRQPTGEARKPKFMITKNNIDNFIVFKYDYLEISSNIKN